MSTGWRRAFCNTVTRDASMEEKHQRNPSSKFTQSEPSTPSLRCKTTTTIENFNTTSKSQVNSPRNLLGFSTPSSPRSPFSILKSTLRLSRSSSCGVCMQSVKKTNHQGMAIYTAECSHVFHFPCIASHLRKQNALICPVCTTTWKHDFPLLKLQQDQNHHEQEKNMVFNSHAQHKHISIPSPTFCTEEIRSYADDEPLVTPKTGQKFIHIPETTDHDEEDIEEFRGFFVNPISSSSNEAFQSKRVSRNVVVSIQPDAAVISIGRTHDTYAVVLKVKAPPPLLNGAARRAPIDLVTVLDVSGSMIGAKLEMLKRAMRLVISSLGSADRLSIVSFSASPTRLLPLTRMTAEGQRFARRIIDRLACSHGTSMAEALKQATKVLEDRRDRNPVATIILLSDGQNDTVPSNNRESNQRFGSSTGSNTRFAHVEIPVHSSGFSREPDENAFTKCVGELLSVVVRDLGIQLGFAPGSDAGEIMAMYSCSGQSTGFGSGCIRLGDLYSEEERELLVEIRVPKLGSRRHVFSIRCCYRDPTKSHELFYGGEQTLLVPIPQTARLGLPKIERLRNAFITTRAIAESRRLIEHNEISNALPLLLSARDLLLQSKTTSSSEYIRDLEAEISGRVWRRQYHEQQMEQMTSWRKTKEGLFVNENGEPFIPRATEKLARVAQIKNSLARVRDLHGFENARF